MVELIGKSKSVAVLIGLLALSFIVSTRPVAASTGSGEDVGQVICTIPVGSSPADLSLNSDNGNVYVSRAGFSTIGNIMSIISGCSVIGQVNIGLGFAGFAAFDSANGNLYVPVCPFSVPLCDPGNVTVVSTLSNTVLTRFPVLAVPNTPVYDPANGLVFLTDRGNGGFHAGLTIINTSTNVVVTTIPGGTAPGQVGFAPLGEAYDSANGNLYVADQSFAVHIVSGSTNTVISSLSTPFSPCFDTYDSKNNDLYFAICGSGGVGIISGATNAVVGTISGFMTTGRPCYDSANDDVYVPSGSNMITVISGSTNSVAGNLIVGNGPNSCLYDNLNGDIYVSNAVDGTVSVISVAPPAKVSVSAFFTDSNLNGLPLDSKGNPSVSVILAGGIVRSTNPGQVLTWVNVTNTSGSSLQSLKLNHTLPVDWTVNPAWMPAKGAIHVFYANSTSLANEIDITQPSTITVSTSNPETVHLAIANLTATAIGHPLMQGQSILLSVKLTYGLIKTSQSTSSYPRNYTDTAIAVAWTQTSFTGSQFTGTASAFFVADAKIVH